MNYSCQDKYTPLLWACEKGRDDVVKILLERNANPELQSVSKL